MKPTGHMMIGAGSPELLLATVCFCLVLAVTFAGIGVIFAVPTTAGALLAIALHRRRASATHPKLGDLSDLGRSSARDLRSVMAESGRGTWRVYPVEDSTTH